MGKLENIDLMKQFVMEADCLESKTFVPIIWECEKYLQPSNIEEFYLQLWTDIHRTVKHPELEDIIQDITLRVLENAIIFETHEEALLYYYRAILNRSIRIIRKEKNREKLRMQNLNLKNSTEDMDICDSCLNLRHIVFVWKDKQQHCKQCAPWVMTQIILARKEG